MLLGDQKTYPDVVATLAAAKRWSGRLRRDGLHPATTRSCASAWRHRLRRGDAAGRADRLGPGRAEQRYNLLEIVENAKVPIMVDAGVGTASNAAIAMELGCDGVLMNTAIPAGAKDPVLMAHAMQLAVETGRAAISARRIPRKRYANASSPVDGLIGWQAAGMLKFRWDAQKPRSTCANAASHVRGSSDRVRRRWPTLSSTRIIRWANIASLTIGVSAQDRTLLVVHAEPEHQDHQREARHQTPSNPSSRLKTCEPNTDAKTSQGVRGKFFSASPGRQRVVLLDDKVARAFPADAVGEALLGLLTLAEKARPAPRVSRKRTAP